MRNNHLSNSFQDYSNILLRLRVESEDNHVWLSCNGERRRKQAYRIVRVFLLFNYAVYHSRSVLHKEMSQFGDCMKIARPNTKRIWCKVLALLVFGSRSCVYRTVILNK